MLPPFYYKGVPDDGSVAYHRGARGGDRGQADPDLSLSLPRQSGLPWQVTLIRRLLDNFGGRIAGLKDSSGDMAYARGGGRDRADFAVFPSTEAALLEARTGAFAGCISATANLNADLCARAWRNGDRRRARRGGRRSASCSTASRSFPA